MCQALQASMSHNCGVGPLFHLFLVSTSFLLAFTSGNQLSEDLRFNINWAGPSLPAPAGLPTSTDSETLVMRTANQEIYHCYLPDLSAFDEKNEEKSGGAHPITLMSSVFQKKSKCSYRLEPFWSYEICHGRHVRQFHEEKNANQEIQIQEFYLGRLSDEDHQKLLTQSNIPIEGVKTMKFDGRDTPFYSVAIKNGTKCDLTGQPRHANIIYICHLASNNEVMSVKETTSCEYDVIVLTPLLCSNQAYRLKENPVHEIRCRPTEGAPTQPKGLMDHEREVFLHNAGLSTQQVESVMTTPKKGKVRIDLTDKTINIIDLTPKQDPAPTPSDKTSSSYILDVGKANHIVKDDELTRQFLAGEYCLRGGSGWWYYEFCFGRYVSQYHEKTAESNSNLLSEGYVQRAAQDCELYLINIQYPGKEERGKRTTIMLGHWNKQAHLDWVAKKVKIKTEETLLLMYTNGDICDLTGQRRSAQIKLKCRKDQKGQPMTIYLVEPSPCSYIVGVESPILCSVIDKADEKGIIG